MHTLRGKFPNMLDASLADSSETHRLDQSLTADVNTSIHISHWDLKNGLVVILFFKLSTDTFTHGVWWTKGRRARAHAQSVDVLRTWI